MQTDPKRRTILTFAEAEDMHAKLAEGKGYTKQQLAASMQRLLDAKRIKVVTEGSPTRQRSRLVVNDRPTVH